MTYCFNLFNNLASTGTTLALKKMIPAKEPPVVVCIGSDLSIGDSLGPICGSKLQERLKGLGCYVYGTLSRPITAHEVGYIQKFIKETHPNRPVLAIDAAVGNAEEIGLIKITDAPLKPGSGVNKNLQTIGTCSIMGIIAEKSVFNYSILSATRLNIVYKMSEIIAEGVSKFIEDILFTSSQKKVEHS